MKPIELTLEINGNFVPSNDTFKKGNSVIMVTPDINKDYWVYRVKVHKTQAIVAFRKFGMLGCGFAQEDDWNTNLPLKMDARQIFDHIKCNKHFKSIKDEDCIKAIEMIQDFVKQHPN